MEKERLPTRQSDASCSPAAAPAPTLDDICAQCEHLVDVLSQEGDSPAGRADGSTAAPPGDRVMEATPRAAGT